MKVCINIQSAIAQRAGVGRYTKSLAEHIGHIAEAGELSLFYFDFKRKGIPFPVAGAEQHVVRWCPGRVAQKAWKTIGWPPFEWFAPKADVYHFPNFIIPPLHSGKTVVTIHDVSFLRFPETTESRNLKYLNAKIRDTVARADAIITDSRFSADEIETLLSVDQAKLHPIHLGLDRSLHPASAEQVRTTRRKYGLEKPYLLMVGTLEPRKNVPFLVELFEQLEGFDGDLVIAGMRGWKFEPILQRIDNSKRRSSIRYIEFVDDRDLPALYTDAELFVFPSRYEGFGFPPLEAMACKTPVVSSSAGSLPEVLGDAAIIIDDFDAETWAEEIQRLLGDRTKRETLAGVAVEHVKQFDWEKTAEETWAVYRRLLEKPGHSGEEA